MAMTDMDYSTCLQPTTLCVQKAPLISRLLSLAPVLGLTILGLALRLYRLDQQSFWLDEFLNIWNLKAPTLSTYLNLFKITTTEQGAAFVYYSLQYFWAHTVGMSAVALRLLPVLLGTLLIPASYGLAASLADRRTAVVTALLVTMSPQHIWFSQEPRPYVLLALEVALATYAFWQAWSGRKRYWILINFLLNALILWTFLFAVLFVLLQCLFLVLRWRNFPKPFLTWLVLHAVLLIVWAVYVTAIPVQNDPYGHANIRDILDEILFDDVVNANPDLLPPWKSNPPDALPPLHQFILEFRPLFDFATMAVILTGFILSLFHVSIHLFAKRPFKNITELHNHCADLFMLMLAILPGAILGIGTMFFRLSFVGCMYTLFSTLGLYFLLGRVVSRIFTSWNILLPIALFTLVYAYQLCIFLPHVTRTNWKDAADFILDSGKQDDLVVEINLVEPREYLKYYLHSSGLQVVRAPTFHAAVEIAARELGVLDPTSPARSQVWLTLERRILHFLNPGLDFETFFKEAFLDWGISWDLRQFPGHYDLIVYCLQKNDARPAVWPPRPVPALLPLDYSDIADALGYHNTTSSEHKKTVDDLRRCVGFWPPLTSFFGLVNALDCLGCKNPGLAHAIIDFVENRGYDECFASFHRGFVFAAEGNRTMSLSSFEKAFSQYAPLRAVFSEFVRKLLILEDYEGAEQEILLLESYGHTLYLDAMQTALRGIKATEN